MSKPIFNAQLRERFERYLEANPVWGSLHIVLEDFNVEDEHVRFCIDWARKENDAEGLELANILLAMSETQRLKIAKTVEWRQALLP